MIRMVFPSNYYIRQQLKLIEEEIDRNENDGGNRRSVKR